MNSEIEIIENINQNIDLGDQNLLNFQKVIEFKPKCPFYNKYCK